MSNEEAMSIRNILEIVKNNIDRTVIDKYPSGVVFMAIPKLNYEQLAQHLKKLDDNCIKDLPKYCLHDLRKNPSDLPKTDTRVLVTVDGNTYQSVDYWDGVFICENPKNIIAWKYIKPLEQ